MSKIVRVQGGDYKLSVGSTSTPGNIIFDTNPNSDPNLPQGSVVITGNLQVNGATTVIESQNLSISDRIIYLNDGEEGNGVNGASLDNTQKFSGIQVKRGILTDALLVFDEQEYLEPTWVFREDVTRNLQPIATNKVKSNNNLTLVVGSSGVVQVSGALLYQEQILDYNILLSSFDIVSISRVNNVATVTTATDHGLVANDIFEIKCLTDGSFDNSLATVISGSGNTLTYSSIGINRSTIFVSGFVKPNAIINNDALPNMKAVADYMSAAVISAFNLTNSRIRENDTVVKVSDLDTSGISEISFEVDGQRRASITNNGLTVDSIRIKNDTIFNVSGNDNILFDSVLNIPNRMSAPSTPIGYVKLYSKNVPSTGGTGLFFVNTTGTNDELISKTKALLYSLIL
jgi:hypothetical protein